MRLLPNFSVGKNGIYQIPDENVQKLSSASNLVSYVNHYYYYYYFRENCLGKYTNPLKIFSLAFVCYGFILS